MNRIELQQQTVDTAKIVDAIKESEKNELFYRRIQKSLDEIYKFMNTTSTQGYYAVAIVLHEWTGGSEVHANYITHKNGETMGNVTIGGELNLYYNKDITKDEIRKVFDTIQYDLLLNGYDVQVYDKYTYCTLPVSFVVHWGEGELNLSNQKSVKQKVLTFLNDLIFED